MPVTALSDTVTLIPQTAGHILQKLAAADRSTVLPLLATKHSVQDGFPRWLELFGREFGGGPVVPCRGMDASVEPQSPSPTGARVVAVTASGGMMGAAIALRLAGAGGRVVVNDRDRTRAEATMTELSGRGAEAVLTVADVSTRDGASRVIEAAMSHWGRLDVMVNVAGGIKGSFRRPLLDITDEEWDRTVEVNLRSAFLCTQLAARVMAAQTSGTIINIGSTSWAGSPERAHYAAAKAGLVALTRSAAVQLGPLGIRVNVVVPGATLTSIVGREDSFGDEEDWSAHNPLGRPNTPDDIAEAVSFLASDQSRNISGQILTVAGGLNPSL